MILTYYNFAKSNKRTQLFLEFLNRYQKLLNVRIVIVEATVDYFLLSNLTSHNVFMHLKYKLDYPFWCKENLINVAIKKLYSSHLSKDWQYVSWIDTDITFLNKKWVQDTIKQLQIYDFVQLCQAEVKVGPNNEILKVRSSAGYVFQLNRYEYPIGYENAAYGLGMAVTRQAFEKTKNLFEYAIVGAGDYLLTLSLMQKNFKYLKKLQKLNIGQNFLEMILEKQYTFKKNNITFSYVKGEVINHWHGTIEDRQYRTRWLLLIDYDPEIDLVRNHEGILNLSQNSRINKTEIANYFMQRNEDNTQI